MPFTVTSPFTPACSTPLAEALVTPVPEGVIDMVKFEPVSVPVPVPLFSPDWTLPVKEIFPELRVNCASKELLLFEPQELDEHPV